MRRFYFVIFVGWAICFAMVLASCSGVEDVVFGGDRQQQGELVFLAVNFGVDPGPAVGARVATGDQDDGGVVHGFSIANPGVGIQEGTAAGYAPSDVWVIQYNGTADDALLSGLPRYVDLSLGNRIQAVTSSSENTLFFVANTHDSNIEWGDIGTIAQFKRAGKRITRQGDCYGNNLSVDKDLIMSGEYRGPVITSNIMVALRRNIARVDLTIKNSLNSGIALQSVQLCNVPQRLCYSSGIASGVEVQPVGTSYFDYPEELLDHNLTLMPSGQSLSFYMPANERGTAPASTSGKSKPLHAPSFSTYFRIVGLDEDLRAYVYKIYPGANLVNDYNLRGNHRYQVEISINAPGDDASDGRVERYGQVDLVSSNSFILHPSLPGALSRVYTFPIDKANEFWAGLDNSLLIGPTDAWTAELIWQDTQQPNLIRFQNQDGTSATTLRGIGPTQRIALITEAGTEGNALIGIKKEGHESAGFLWSWHVWVTDYDPQYRAAPVSGQYIYSVPGGAVHRYQGEQWEAGGPYQDKYIMDRNLGARSTGQVIQGVLYYQFGRKDPFPYSGGGYVLCDINGRQLSASDPYNSAVLKENSGYGVTFATSVLRPTCYFYRPLAAYGDGDWCIEGRTTNREWNSLVDGKTNKSLFDPCPTGWRIPPYGALSDFIHNRDDPSLSTVHGVTRDQRLGWIYQGVYGVRYWPAKKEILGEILYPSTGYRLRESGNTSGVDAFAWSWTSTAADSKYGTCLYAQSRDVSLRSGYGRSIGLVARCIQE